MAVERDPVTAEIAAANLAHQGADAQVITGDAERLVAEWLPRVDAVFCDPARRSGSGRLWRIEDFTPPWSLVGGLLDGARPAAVKLGPALPHRLIPEGVEAEWIGDHGDTVEVCLHAGPQVLASRTALIMPDHRLVAVDERPPVRPIGRFLHEPDGAVIRCGGIAVVAAALDAGLVDGQLAYLTGDRIALTPFATSFAVREILPFRETVLRHWVREHLVGRLEIKCRGVDIDPAVLRRRLRPDGPGSATMIITRTPDGARVIIADRVAPPS